MSDESSFTLRFVNSYTNNYLNSNFNKPATKTIHHFMVTAIFDLKFEFDIHIEGVVKKNPLEKS